MGFSDELPAGTALERTAKAPLNASEQEVDKLRMKLR